MSKKYAEIMDKIELSEESRERILAKIRDLNLTEKKKPEVRTEKFLRFGHQWGLYAAACLVVVLFAAIAGNSLRRNGLIFTGDSGTVTVSPGAVSEGTDSQEDDGLQETEEDMMDSGYFIMEADSAEELSELVGFPVDDVKEIPFAAATQTYCAYYGTLAEITYSSADQTLTYRKSEGTEDNSGDYSEYGNVEQQTIEGQEVTVKGNGDSCQAAVWTDGEYFYSVLFEEGISEDEMLKFLRANLTGQS